MPPVFTLRGLAAFEAAEGLVPYVNPNQAQFDAAKAAEHAAEAAQRNRLDRQARAVKAQAEAVYLRAQVDAPAPFADRRTPLQRELDELTPKLRAQELLEEKVEPADKSRKLLSMRDNVVKKTDALAPLDRLIASREKREAAALAAEKAATAATAAAAEAADIAATRSATALPLTAAAALLPQLSEVWNKGQLVQVKGLNGAPSTFTDRSIRQLEEELLQMRAELARFAFADRPPSAVRYCDAFEASLDARAHRVACKRCATEHGLVRDAPTKTLLQGLLTEMEVLAAPGVDVAGLDAEQLAKRQVGEALIAMRDAPGAAVEGKMVGVLVCADGHVYRAYSGVISGMAASPSGWADAIPLVGAGSHLLSANGVATPLTALPRPTGTVHGVCAAPKLIQQAYRDGRVPVKLAEAWYGKSGEGKTHKGVVASCATCMLNLDVQLCPNMPP